MYFQLLGALKVRLDGDPVGLGGPRQQRLLAMLLVEANRVVSAGRLIEAMWDAEPPATAARQVHNAVAAIRRSFASARHIVVKDGPGYRIHVDPQDVDAHRFTTMIARASAAAAAGHTATAMELLEAGLDLWTGPALSGLDSQVLEIAAAKLEEERLSATEQLTGLRLQEGDATALVARLGELVSRNPLREETRRLLILALYHSGRKADALNVYEQGRRLLRDEIGVDPSASLRELHERILREDLPQPGHKPEAAGLVPVQGAQAAGLQAGHGQAGASRSFLPYDTVHFTGRGSELRFLMARSRSATEHALGIVAIDGMAGVGKTALAIRLAHQLAPQYPEGHLFIDLNGYTHGHDPLEPDAALEHLLLDIGLPQAQIPQGSRQRAARWRAEIAERRILVVLDNALDARQIRPLLPGTGKAHVIITSQRRLSGLDGVTSHSLDVFSATDAAALFTSIAGAARTRHRPHAVAEVVARCGCLPLAVSIAAYRFHSRPAWSLDHLMLRLRDERGRLAELSLRDRSVASPFEVSYRNLPAQQRRLLRMLGVATGDGEEFDASTAAALMHIDVPEADLLLEELLDANMLRQRRAGRYHMHELLREYARQYATAAAPGADAQRMRGQGSFDGRDKQALFAVPPPVPHQKVTTCTSHTGQS